ncbi:hypothetical protein C8J57DRAFT_1297649 [Mycena rebaudengoi]|nr:hypothetical protein C8J57DRAFT_1297649 [Mycena rebaudengoi]
MSADQITPDPPVPFSFQGSIFVLPTDTEANDLHSRIDVSHVEKYNEIARLITLALYHLSSSDIALAVSLSILLNIFVHNRTASRTPNGERTPPTAEMIVDILTKSHPDIIICNLPDNAEGTIRWGKVKRGPSDLARRHKIFIAKELCDAIMAKPNLLKPQAHRLRTFHRALFLVVLSHELIHILVKKIFSPQITIPALATPGIRGKGAPGLGFELKYFQFHLAAELPKHGLVKGQRLWTITQLLAEGDEVYILSDAAVVRFIQSYSTPVVYVLDEKDTATVAPLDTTQDTVRWRMGQCSAETKRPTVVATVPVIELGTLDWDRY